MILLDTNVLIWLTERARISEEARRSIEGAAATSGIFVSAVTAWEIGTLIRVGRLRSPITPTAWFAQATRRLGFRVIDLDAATALASAELPEWDHRDPADRLLVATARLLDVAIVTRDREILAYAAAGHVRAVAC